ncbi:MAG: hypothetical protein FWG70_00375 [Oscillospiraceae bacterium]|nr:hypothetical protein [Oscillospiraceae bacterium]
MLTAPKKSAGKNEKALSDTASFKKVAYGFSPDEVNLYIHSLRKKTLELQAENDKLMESVNPEKLAQTENLERYLAEANEKYFKERDLVVMLEGECKRLGTELDELSNKLRAGGSADDAAKLKVAENKAAKAEFSLSKAESRASEAEAKVAGLEQSLAESKAKATEYKLRLDDAEEKLAAAELSSLTIGGSTDEMVAEAKERAEKAEARATEASAKASILEEKADDLKAKVAELKSKLTEAESKLASAPASGGKVDEQLKEMQEKLKKTEAEASASATRVTVLEERLEGAKAETAGYKSQLGEAKSNLLRAEDKLAKAEAEVAKTEAEVSKAAKAAPAATKETSKQDAAKIADAEAKITALEDKLAKTEKSLSEAKEAAVKAAAVPVKAAPAAKATASSPDVPIFEEAPAARDKGDEFLSADGKDKKAAKTEQESETALLANKLSSVLAEIDDLKSRISKTEESETDGEAVSEAKKAKKSRRSDEGEESGRSLSRAELKIQILQDDAEDSYIIPDKYIKMIEDVEEQEDDDDFSYLLTDSAATDDMMMAVIDDDDDISNLLISGPTPSMPAFSKAPPPKKEADATPPSKSADKAKPAADASAGAKPAAKPAPHSGAKKPDEILLSGMDDSIKAGTKSESSKSKQSELIKYDDAELDQNFEDLLNLDFRKVQPKGENLVPKNPTIKEKGDDLVAGNPNQKEKGVDLNEDIFETVVGQASDPNKNVRARSEVSGDFAGAGYDFMLESDDMELI